MKYLFFFSFVLVLATGCRRLVAEKIVDENQLKWAILNSIEIPIHPGDTILFKQQLKGNICLNGRRSYANRQRRYNRNHFYQPFLSNAPFRDSLLKKNEGKILFMDKESDYLIYEEDTLFWRNKIYFQISGTAYRKNKVQIVHSDSYHGSGHYYFKLFTYENGKWTYIITSKGTQ